MNFANILEFIMNALIVISAVLIIIGLVLLWKMTVIYKWHLQNEKSKEIALKENENNE